MSKKGPSLCIIAIIVILTTSTVLTLTDFGKFGVAQGQSNTTSLSLSLSLTPEQKAAMCDPNNPKLNFVNGTESRICGIPKTITNTTSSNMTTGAEEPPSEGIAPSAVPPPLEPEPEPEG
jgi:hypothetical protein